jgi:hypothetical protein
MRQLDGGILGDDAHLDDHLDRIAGFECVEAAQSVGQSAACRGGASPLRRIRRARGGAEEYRESHREETEIHPLDGKPRPPTGA